MASPFDSLVLMLKDIGFFGYFLPWLLTFAVIYGLLVKSKVLGEDQKIIGVVSLAISFFVIGFGSIVLGEFFASLFGMGIVVLSVILVMVLFVAMAGGDVSKLAENKQVIALLVGVGIVVIIALMSSFGLVVSEEWLTLLAVLVMLGIAFAFITSNNK